MPPGDLARKRTAWGGRWNMELGVQFWHLFLDGPRPKEGNIRNLQQEMSRYGAGHYFHPFQASVAIVGPSRDSFPFLSFLPDKLS